MFKGQGANQALQVQYNIKDCRRIQRALSIELPVQFVLPGMALAMSTQLTLIDLKFNFFFFSPFNTVPVLYLV
jgi:hypothetical protein